jgi:hypothetical protein
LFEYLDAKKHDSRAWGLDTSATKWKLFVCNARTFFTGRNRNILKRSGTNRIEDCRSLTVA